VGGVRRTAPARIARPAVDGLDIVRHNVVIVRDGEHLSLRIAATIDAVHAVSTGLSPSDT
jgi:hypothetical protein